MKRQIKSVFQYTDYRVLVLDDFTLRSTRNQKYSLRAYARDLELSPGYLSSILRGKKHFKHVNCRDVFSRLGFNSSEELQYLENLVVYQTSADVLIKEEAFRFMKSNYESLGLTKRPKNLERDGLLASLAHYLLFMITQRETDLAKVKSWLALFEIGEKDFQLALSDLVAEKFLALKENEIVVLEKNLAINHSDKILAFATMLQSYMATLLKKDGGIAFPERSTHTLIMGFDEESYAQAIEVYKHFLHQIYRISQNSKSFDRITIFSDMMLTKKRIKSISENN